MRKHINLLREKTIFKRGGGLFFEKIYIPEIKKKIVIYKNKSIKLSGEGRKEFTIHNIMEFLSKLVYLRGKYLPQMLMEFSILEII